MESSSELALSIVIPIFNEVDNLEPLYVELERALRPFGDDCEIIFVDDHSTDGSLDLLLSLRGRDPRLRIVRFRRNFGQTAALGAGFEHSRGEVVVTLDGDLQNDPADIPTLVAELEQGYDIVAGWRKNRHDGFLLRKVPSRIANRLIALVTGTRIHDTGCTLKAFRRKLVKNLPIYAEQHRFLPAMSAGSGARVSEVVVNHRPRRFGKSKYGLERAARVLLDLLTIKMIAQFSHKPLHYFGLATLPITLFSLFFLFLGIFDASTLEVDSRWPEFIVFTVLLFFLLATYFVILGLVSELALTASGMHRRRVLDRLMSDQE